jgi:hypothetical protein
MIQLKNDVAKTVLVPNVVERFFVAYWSKAEGWTIHGYTLHTTPESAVQQLISYADSFDKVDDDWKPRYYKVLSVNLEIPNSGENLNVETK